MTNLQYYLQLTGAAIALFGIPHDPLWAQLPHSASAAKTTLKPPQPTSQLGSQHRWWWADQ